MRLIDADAMLVRLEEWNTSDSTDKALYNFTLNRILEQPTIEPESNWISCKERLPEEEVDVLCCRNNKTIAIMHFNPVLTTRYPKGFSVVENNFSWRQDNVVAWMPLPEPYQPKEE